MKLNSKTTSALSVFVAMAMISTSLVNAQGISLRGIGAANESMAGAGTAAPISAAGALHWNPASIADFRSNQAEMGIGMVYPDSRVSSTVGPFTGSSRSESGVAPIPTMAIVMKTRNPRVTMGLGIYAIAGFKLNYEASTTNPIHLPQGTLAPLPSFGRVNTEAQFFQIVPTLAYALNDCWSVGFAPTLTLGQLGIQPLLAGPVGAAGYSNGSGTRFHWGGGGQFGIYYKPDQRFAAGLTVKSEQYFEEFRFKGQDNATGQPIEATADFEYPLIVSIGTSYKLSPRTLVATDVRYFDYGQANGFGTVGLEADGSLSGLSWKSVMSVATGIQHQVSHNLKIRGGYVWNENPLTSQNIFLNSAAPLNLQHVASLGVELRLTHNMTTSMAYLHAFDEATSGLYAGQPGTNVTARTAAYAVSAGVNIDF